MKTKLTALCALLLLIGSLLAGPISITPTPEQMIGAQYAADQYNATAKAQFDASTKANYEAAQAALSVEKRVPYNAEKVAQYKPLTAEAYTAWRFSEVLDSYADQERRTRINAPKSQALIDTISRALAGKSEAETDAALKAIGATLAPASRSKPKTR